MAGFSSRTKDPLDLRVVPHPAVTVFIALSDGGVLSDAGGRQWRGSIVTGLVPGDIRGQGRDIKCLQVRMSPLVAPALLGISSELGGSVVALEDLWGRDARRTEEQLRSAGTWEERFAITEAAMARRLGPGPAVQPEVAFVWKHMVTMQGRVRVVRLADDVGWSRKRLWSRFGSQIGLTPKRAAQLIRFDHVAHRLAAGHSPALVAAESGYADQSHLHRDVMIFTGITPKAVAGAPWLAVDDVAWSGPGSDT